MTDTAATEFISKTITDEAFSEAFAACVADRSFEDAVPDILTFALENGYEIDQQSLSDAFQSIKDMGEGDLTDDDLDDVSGGFFGAALSGVGDLMRKVQGEKSVGKNSYGAEWNHKQFYNPKSTKFWFGT